MTDLKILEHIDGIRKAKGLTRRQMSELMGDISVEGLNKIFERNACPRAETIARMLEVLNLPTYPAEWFKSKNGVNEDE